MFSSAQLIQASLILSQFLYALRIPQPIENCVLVTGATGYIGRSVVRELVDRKIPTVAVVRSNDISERSKQYLKGSTVVVSNVCDSSDLIRVYNTFSPTATICCLASRSGVKRDTWAIDYEASLNCLRAQESVLSKNQFSNNLNHFVLLSAYCVGKPLLQFHYAKLKLEAAIRASSLVSHSIVRPTAFFKSVDGQFESVTKGFPTLYFGGGSVRANPISEKDLAEYLVTCATNPQQLNLLNRTIDIGGPDQPLSKFQQLQLIYDTLNIPTSKRRSIPIPMEVLDTIINSFQFLEKVCGNFGMEKYSLQCQDAAEIARIVRYYAQEDMVTTEEEQKYGRILVMLFLEHLLLGLKIVLGNVIDDIPPEVREEMAKRLAEKTESNIGKTVELFTHQTKSMAYDKLAHTAEKDPNADSIPLKNAVLLVDKKIKTDLMIADQVATSNISSAPKPTAAKDKGNNGKQSTNETKELDATSQLKALFERDAIGFHPIILLSIVFLPYLCAYYNFPLLLYIPIALLVLTYIQSQKDRADRQFAVGVVTDANLLKLIGQEMPSWFHDSEFQRVEWLNFVLSKLFPQIAHAVEAIVKEKVQPSIDENTPFYLPRLEIVHANLGSVSPKITGVRVFHNRESSIRLDLELKWSSDLQVTLKLNTTPLPINVELTDLRVTANVRVELLELTNRLPCFRALSITCMKKPKIDFSLKIASLDIMNMGAGSDYNITSLVQTIIDSVLAGVCLYPKKIMVPMDDKVDLDDLANETPDGILLVRLIRGEQLLAVNYTGNSDPYVEFVSSHDPSHIQRSTVKYSTIKPVWHEDFTFFVHDKNTETITVSVYDSDITNQMPTFMGNAVIHLDLIKRNHKTPQEFNLVLSDVSTGILRVSCAYRSINKKKSTANLHKMNERGEIIEDHVLYTDIDDKELEDNTALIGEDSEYDDVRPYEEGRDTLTEMPSFNSPNNRASKRGKSIDDNSSDVSSIRGRRLSNTFSSLQNAQQKMEDYHKSLEQMVGVLNISQIKLKDIKLPDGFLTSTTLRLYVTFTIGNKILKTKYIKNSQDPTFIETFAFLINSLNEEMVVNVYNKVKYTMSMTPKPIASVKIALKSFAKNDDDFASGDGKNRRASVIQKVEQDYPLNGLKDEGYVSFKAVLSLFD